MSKWRKRPVEIEAWQNGSDEPKPDWLLAAEREGRIRPALAASPPGSLAVDTSEGTMRADPTDWIICGVAGEIYPCKPDIFDATYDPA